MKPALFLLLIVLTSCSTPVPPAEKTKPYVGMSQEEVRKNYGKPGKISRTDEGETWTYDNMAQVWIPYNFGWRPKQHVFLFGPDGKVSKFQVDDF